MTNGVKPRKRPKVLSGKTYREKTGCGNMYVTINRDDTGPFEVFAALGKSGQCGAAQIEAICRTASLALRAGIDTKAIIKQLQGIRCPSPSLEGSTEILSCADAIAHALSEEINGQTNR